MSSLPIQPDPYIDNAAKVLAELNSTLSGDEIAFMDEARTRPDYGRPPLVAEIDAVLTIPGQKPLNVTLGIHGRFTPAMKGGHEPGERPYEPDDEAGFEVEAIMLGETDVTAELGAAGEEAVSQYVMENCEE